MSKIPCRDCGVYTWNRTERCGICRHIWRRWVFDGKMHEMDREVIVKKIYEEVNTSEKEIDKILSVFLREAKKLDVKEAESWSPFGERVYQICKSLRSKYD